MSLTRTAFVLTLALSVVALPAASDDDPPPAVWPVDAAWPRTFPLAETIALVTGESRLFVVEAGQVSALSWSDGALIWKKDLSATTRPVIDEGHIFVSAGNSIHALSDATGAEQWRLPSGPISISPTTRSGWLIVPGGDDSLQGVSTAEGREVWRVALPAPLTTPVVIDGDMVIGACADGAIRAWRIADGSLSWERETGTRPTQLLASNGYVFIGGQDGRLISLRQRDGRLNWAYAYKMPIAGRLAADQTHVYVTTIDNSVHAHAFNGHRTWHQLLASRVVDGMFSDSGHVFVPQSNGEIRMFLARDGKRAGRLNSSPEDALVLGGLVTGGAGAQLRLAIAASAGSQLALTTYRRTGLAAVPARGAPPSTPLLLTQPGGRP